MKKTLVAAACALLIGVGIGYLAGRTPPEEQQSSVWRQEVLGPTREVYRFFNHRPVPAAAYKILFVGNSITCHPSIQGVWDGFRGMAATDYARDYVHIFARHVQERLPNRPVEIFITTSPGLKNAITDMQTVPVEPDLVVFQKGDNEPEFNTEYKERFNQMVSSFGGRTEKIVMGEWYNAGRNDFIKASAAEVGAAFVDLHTIQTDGRYSGDGGPFHHNGVKTHPNDAGMQAIAQGLAQAFDARILPRLNP
jgi:hypothetical protein